MPQIHRLDPPTEDLGCETRNEAPQLPHPDFSVFFQSLSRRRSIILTTTAITMAFAIVYLIFTTPQFSASSMILIDTKSNAGLRNVPTLSDANVESANLESQVEVLKSERILRQVVLDQKLIDDPALAPGLVSRTISAVINTIAIWRISQPHDPEDDPKVTAAEQALEKLTEVKRAGVTYVIEISATMPNAVQAARVANSYAKTYIDDQQRLREDLSRRQSKMLQDRSTELELKARQAEQAVAEMKFSGSLQGANSASANVVLKDLESSAQNYRTLHDKFLEQATETWQQQYLSVPDAQIASPAYAPLSKSSPKSLIVLASSLLIGLSAGVVIILLLDRRKIGITTT